MNKVKVTVCGKTFNLSTDNDVYRIMALAEKLDKDIAALNESMPSLGVQSAAIICALSAYEEISRTDESIDNLRMQIKEYVDEAARARDARDKAVIEADRLRKKLDSLGCPAEGSSSTEEDAEQLVLENTITPSVTIPVSEPVMPDAAPPKQGRNKRNRH